VVSIQTELDIRFCGDKSMPKHVKPQIFLVDGEMSESSPIVASMQKEGYKVKCFANDKECLDKLGSMRCDLLISDLETSQSDGLVFLKKAHSIVPGLPVILISEESNIPIAVQSIKMGAEDFCKKPLCPTGFLNKVRKLISERIINNGKAIGPLTDTQKKILKLIMDGKSNNEIADMIGRSIRTVELHKSNIMSKFDVDNNVDLVKKAFPIDLS
jgi:two-component system response regulator FixJ